MIEGRKEDERPCKDVVVLLDEVEGELKKDQCKAASKIAPEGEEVEVKALEQKPTFWPEHKDCC